MILYMRLWACILTELLNIYKMGQTDAIEDIVKDFVAFGIISEIDEVIAHSFLQLDVGEELRVNSISYKKDEDFKSVSQIVKDVWARDESTTLKVYLIARILFYASLQFFYVNIYFYFFPFLIVIMIFNFGDNQLAKSEE